MSQKELSAAKDKVEEKVKLAQELCGIECRASNIIDSLLSYFRAEKNYIDEVFSKKGIRRGENKA